MPGPNRSKDDCMWGSVPLISTYFKQSGNPCFIEQARALRDAWVETKDPRRVSVEAD
jgi:hypothetical protein